MPTRTHTATLAPVMPALLAVGLCAITSGLLAQTAQPGPAQGATDRPGFAEVKAQGRANSRYLGGARPNDAGARPEADLAHFRAKISPILQGACVGCHGPKKQKGDFRIDTLDPDLFVGEDVDWWLDVLSVLTNGEMPPEDADPLAEDRRREVVDWLAGEMQVASAARRAQVEHSTFRRMARYEYNYALQDLLGLPFAFAEDLPPDPVSEDGFENSSEVLHLTVTQFRAYLESGREALNAATVIGAEPQPLYWNIDLQSRAQAAWRRQDAEVDKFRAKHPEDTAENQAKLQKLRQRFRSRPGGAFFFNPSTGRYARTSWHYAGAKHAWHPTSSRPEAPPIGEDRVVLSPRASLIVELGNQVPDRGTMRVRARASRGPGHTGPAPTLRLMFGWQASNDSRAVMRLPDAEVTVTNGPDEPRFYEWNLATSQIYPRNLVRKTAKMGATPSPSEYLKIVHDSRTGGDVLIDFLEVTAPFHASWPPPSHRRIFSAEEPRTDESAYAHEILVRFLSRAWRRPPTKPEVDRKMRLFHRLRETCGDFQEAVLETLATALASPNFLYLIASSPDAGGHPDAGARLPDHELATRLAAFLWCSIPDDHLRTIADRGQLTTPSVFAAEVDRMLRDPKARRFSEQFASQWLGLQLLDFLHVDKKRYPGFDDGLHEAMRQEPIAFFHEVLSRDLSVLDFVQADFTMVNERLAKHYGIDQVTGSQFRRVELIEQRDRGGLLTQAGLLAMNSDGKDSHPLKRGVWLLERLLNDPPPPPPAAVPEIDLTDPEVAKMTLKQRIEDHRNAAACKSCHQKIDPWGIAFENYDAVGQFRTKVQGEPVDAASVLFNRQRLDGVDGLKRFLLTSRQDQFVRAMVHHLTTFALGRPLSFGDRAALEDITADVRQQGDGLATMIRCIAQSDLFQSK